MHDAVITEVDEDPDGTVWKTVVTVDGEEFLLDDWPALWSWSDVFSDEGPTATEVGDKLRVALDRDPDPEYNWAYDVSRYKPFSWSAALLGLAFLLGLLTTVRGLVVRSVMLREGARWQWWRTRRPFTVRITEVREQRQDPRFLWWYWLLEIVADRKHVVHHLVVERDGRYRFWEVKTAHEVTIEPGTEIQVVGRWRHRGWLLGLTEPPLYPVERLD